jgi:integrase
MSVRKRTWKTAKGETKEAWVVDYADQTGKRRLRTFDRKKEADAFAAETSVEIEEGVHTPSSASITVAAAADLWLQSCQANHLESATIDAYEQHCRLHIKPFLGRKKLSELTAPLVREFEDRLRRGDPAPGEENGKARSPAMVRRIITSLSTLISDAQERGLVSRNVVKDLRSRRKRGRQAQHESRHARKLKVGVDIPSPEEIRAFLASLTGRYRPLLLTATFTGLRSSELRGLRWTDIDFERRKLHVRQRVDKRNVSGPPKTASGARTVPLPPIVVNTLKEWKLACPKSPHGLAFAFPHRSQLTNRAL